MVVPTEAERQDADIERFLSKVDIGGPTMPHMDTQCHVWTGGVERQGYGKFTWSRDAKKTTIKSHRWGWLTFVGPIPDETPFVLHHCDNPPCVRLVHLYLGTHAQNTDDMVNRGRQAAGERNGGGAKLTDADVVVIRRRAARGESNASLAREYGVSTVALGFVVNRKTWKHVPDGIGVSE